MKENNIERGGKEGIKEFRGRIKNGGHIKVPF